MPTYQYACTNPDCGNRFELVQSFSDPAASNCPVCGQPVRKVYGTVGVVFKGSGFYRTDSRAAASGSSVSSKADGAAKGSESGKADSPKSDSSAAKSDSAKPAASGSGATKAAATA